MHHVVRRIPRRTRRFRWSMGPLRLAMTVTVPSLAALRLVRE